MTKPTKWHVRPAMTQISLGIRLVWSETSLSAWRMPRWIWVFAGRTAILLVLSWGGSISWHYDSMSICVIKFITILQQKWYLLFNYFDNITEAHWRQMCYSNIHYGYDYMSQLMRLWYLLHRRPARPEPSLFAHMNYGNRRRIRLKIRHLAPLDGRACAFEEWVYGGRKVP